MNENISQQLVKLDFEKVVEDEHKIVRTFTKGNFSVIEFFCAKNKKTEILLYKEKVKERIDNFLASFIATEEGWELAKFCCQKLYEKSQEKDEVKKTYSNGIMLSPSGEMMCRCGKDRIKWYLKKGLATLESENPLTIKLTFEPEAYGKKDDPYYLQEIKNQCVVCGSTQELSKHHVIPHCFRKFLPKEIKENSSHDILLLCREHHNQYEKEADKVKKELAKKYGCDLYGKNLKTDLKLKKIKDGAIELLNKNSKISIAKRKRLNNLIKNHFDKKKISQQDLESASKIKYKMKNKDFVDFGEHIVNSVSSLDDFMIMWRKHFVELLSPQFLPDFWDINRKILKKERVQMVPLRRKEIYQADDGRYIEVFTKIGEVEEIKNEENVEEVVDNEGGTVPEQAFVGVVQIAIGQSLKEIRFDIPDVATIEEAFDKYHGLAEAAHQGFVEMIQERMRENQSKIITAGSGTLQELDQMSQHQGGKPSIII